MYVLLPTVKQDSRDWERSCVYRLKIFQTFKKKNTQDLMVQVSYQSRTVDNIIGLKSHKNHMLQE